jgi:hypothetical protein
MKTQLCQHLESLHEVIAADKDYCEECIKTGSPWLHLRVCQTCGSVLCCDSSPNQHATKHAHQSGHPVITSGQPGEYWAYCYPDDMDMDTSAMI